MEYNIEIKEKRTEFSKTYYKGDNSYTLVAQRKPMHYHDGNTWRDISCNIENKQVNKTVYNANLLDNEIGYSFTYKKDGSRIDVKLDKIGDTPVTYSEPVIENNIATWYDISTDFDFIIEFLPYRVRCWKRLKTENAEKSVTFTIIEDDNKKGINVSDVIFGYDESGKQTHSTINKGTEKKYKTADTNKNVKEYTLTETFEGKVILRDKKRVKTLSDHVFYPVMIDADVEVTVAAGADDGYDYASASNTTYPPFTFTSFDNTKTKIKLADYFLGPSTYPTPLKVIQAFTRFDGITIPSDVTIDDATLKLTGGGSTVNFKVYAFDESDPNAPAGAGALRSKTTGIASNVVTTNVTSGPATFDIVVTSIVNELYTSYGPYSNQAMVFFYRIASRLSGASNNISFNAYEAVSGEPQLWINYTAAGGDPQWPKNTGLDLSIRDLNFEMTEGNPNPDDQTFTISNSGDTGTTMLWQAHDNRAWITTSPTSGNDVEGGGGDTITISVDGTGFTNDDSPYTGSVTVTAASGGVPALGSPKGVLITLTVNAQLPAQWPKYPGLQVTPTTLSFNSEEGSNPANQTLTVTNSASDGVIMWGVTDDASWLTVTPTSGSNTGENDDLTVSVDTTGLYASASPYLSTITVTAGSASPVPRQDVAGSPFDVTVQLDLTPPVNLRTQKLYYAIIKQGSSAESDNFNDTAIDAKWTESYQTGGGGSESGGQLHLTAGDLDVNTTAFNGSGIYQEFSGNFDYFCKIDDWDALAAGESFGLAAWIDSTHYIAVNRNNSGLGYLFKNGGSSSSSDNTGTEGKPQYFRVARVSSTITVYASTNGTSWTQKTQASLGSGTCRIWLYANDNNGGGGFVEDVDYFWNIDANLTNESINLFDSNINYTDYLAVQTSAGYGYAELGSTASSAAKELRIRKGETTYAVLNNLDN